MAMVDAAGLDRVETTAGKDHTVTILSFRFRDGKCREIKPYYFDHAAFRAAAALKAE